jgi:hypothetical protein
MLWQRSPALQMATSLSVIDPVDADDVGLDAQDGL